MDKLKTKVKTIVFYTFLYSLPHDAHYDNVLYISFIFSNSAQSSMLQSDELLTSRDETPFTSLNYSAANDSIFSEAREESQIEHMEVNSPSRSGDGSGHASESESDVAAETSDNDENQTATNLYSSSSSDNEDPYEFDFDKRVSLNSSKNMIRKR